MAGTINTISGGPLSASISKDQSEELWSKRARIRDIIAFTDEDLQQVQVPHDDPVVISLTIANFTVNRILVDNESLADILYYDTYQKMRLPSIQL